jgi:predicted nucleotidyltransferase
LENKREVLHLVTLGVTIVTKMGTVQGNNNLGTTLFGKARRGILSLLYGHADEEYYLRQIARTTGIGIGPVQRELKQLTDSHIIRRRVQGRQVYYQANPDSPIFKELKSLITKTTGIVDTLRSVLAPIAEDIDLAFVYGSLARGDENSSSDIDLMIVGKPTFAEISTKLHPSQEKLGREINFTIYPAFEFKSKISEGGHFLNNVLSEPKIFIIGDEYELNRMVKSRKTN